MPRSKAQVREWWRREARRLHPDHNPDPRATDDFIALKAEYAKRLRSAFECVVCEDTGQQENIRGVTVLRTPCKECSDADTQ